MVWPASCLPACLPTSRHHHCHLAHPPASSPLPAMRCSLRAIEAKQARFGLVECLNHGLLNAYPVTYEKDGELVAHVSLLVAAAMGR